MSKNDGGAAFPKGFPDARDKGMSLRDWFAGMAMQGWLASWPSDSAPPKPEDLAPFSYGIADAMIAAREQE